jgi:hypothetical protein
MRGRRGCGRQAGEAPVGAALCGGSPPERSSHSPGGRQINRRAEAPPLGGAGRNPALCYAGLPPAHEPSMPNGTVLTHRWRSHRPRAWRYSAAWPLGHTAPNQPFSALPIEAKLVKDGIGPVDTVQIHSVVKHCQCLSRAGAAFHLLPVEKLGHDLLWISLSSSVLADHSRSFQIIVITRTHRSIRKARCTMRRTSVILASFRSSFRAVQHAAWRPMHARGCQSPRMISKRALIGGIGP